MVGGGGPRWTRQVAYLRPGEGAGHVPVYFRHIADEMKLPRVVVTRHPMGRPLGAAGDHSRHRRVAIAALELFDSADEPTMVELPEPFRVGETP